MDGLRVSTGEQQKCDERHAKHDERKKDKLRAEATARTDKIEIRKFSKA